MVSPDHLRINPCCLCSEAGACACMQVPKPETRANFHAGQFGAAQGLVPVNAAYFSAETGV